MGGGESLIGIHLKGRGFALQFKDGVAEFVEVVVDAGRCGRFLQLCDAVAAGGDEVALQPADFGRGEIKWRVADEDGFCRCGFHQIQHVGSKLRFRLAVGGVAGADDGVEPAVHVQVLEGGARMVADFVSKHRELMTALFQGLEDPCCAGQCQYIFEHDLLEMLAEQWQRGVDVLFAQQAFEGHRYATADGGAHGGVVGFGETELALRMRNAPVDGGEMVDQCPVQVEEYGLHGKLFFM